jgi:uncharacterized protein
MRKKSTTGFTSNFLAAAVLVVLSSITTHSVMAQAPGFKIGDRLPSPATTKSTSKSKAVTTYIDTPWEALSPADYDPFAAIRDLNFATLKDSDPRAMEALAKLMESRNKAPVVQELQGKQIRISGFLVPVTKVKDDVIEFLLVPYFGACIHTPPPPSNNVIMVIPDKPYKGGTTMDAVTVSGQMTIHRTDSPWGTAAYKLTAQRVTKYAMPPAK